MVVVGRPGYRIDSRTIKGGSEVSSLIVSFVESSNHCILASCFLVLVCFSLWVLDLMVILMTSLSSSKTEFACVFYDVFSVGGFTGLIRRRVLTIFLCGFSHLIILDISIKIVLAHVVSFPTNLFSLNSESVCKSCVCFGKGCNGTTATRADVIFTTAPEQYYRCSWAVVPLQSSTWRKYALEAIIKLLFISSYHDKCLLFMLELY